MIIIPDKILRPFSQFFLFLFTSHPQNLLLLSLIHLWLLPLLPAFFLSLGTKDRESETMATCSNALPVGKLFHKPHSSSILKNSPFAPFIPAITIDDKNNNVQLIKATRVFSSQRNFTTAVSKKAAAGGGDSPISPVDDDNEDGVSLGTLKLPGNTDLARFETLLFQWANSLCQGANLPMPMPLKVDKIPGGARIGFITIGDGESEVPAYIDCLVFPPTDSSGPIFRAIRNGARKSEAPPGEPRIMRSLLGALKKSVELASI